LGYGDVTNRGDSSNEMGDYLPPVDLGSGFIPTHECGIGVPTSAPTLFPSITYSPTLLPVPCANEFGGEFFICILTKNQNIRCWGKNLEGKIIIFLFNHCSFFKGELGIGSVAHQGDDANEMGDYIQNVDLGGGFSPIHLFSGSEHTCAISEASSVKCWGDNGYGKIFVKKTNL